MPGQPPSGAVEAAAFKRYLPFAQGAGFSGQSLITIMAIAFAESGLNPANQATVSNPGHPDDGSIDRGILQINSHWHPEVTDACAYDPACSFKAAWRISQQGKNFNEWNSYKNRSTQYNIGLQDSTAVINNQPIPNPDATSIAGANGQYQGINLDPFAMFQALFNQLPSWGIHIALFMGALMFLIVGLWILTSNPASDTGSAITTTANNAAKSVGTRIGTAIGGNR